ncbi:hypothetical protein LIPSTDRAFT_68731 [Lipomyces starkeyi NRRL Y-11557]|uniref:Uncharacterized protein n=1 Tax=Lipomyces starkeyi NRRL Y-11557 TaxID=675824 RepID=A0A1E3QE79_LIPST|nr:hypothetical protein LIPSTDRAFT_68731 [Lipomyces starkeyi NRRL Y-11557]
MGSDGHVSEPDNMEIAHFLPPLSPSLPAIVEETSLDHGAFSLEASLPPSGDNASNLTPAERSTTAIDGNRENYRVETLTSQLADQLCTFHGCCVDCHRISKLQHSQDSREHIPLATHLESTAGLCPEVLSSTRIPSPDDDLFGKTRTASREIYCGLTFGNPALYICLDEDGQVTNAAGTSFDVDSVTGFPTNLAVAKQGVRWFPTQMQVSDLQSDLHLHPRQVHYFDEAGNQHRVRRPVHKIPHYNVWLSHLASKRCRYI